MAYLNGGQLDGRRILSEEMVYMMTTDSHIAAGKTPESSVYDEVYHGPGWFVVPQTISAFSISSQV
jgi:hypothetical protein